VLRRRLVPPHAKGEFPFQGRQKHTLPPRAHARAYTYVGGPVGRVERSDRVRVRRRALAGFRGGTGEGTAPHVSHVSHIPHRIVKSDRLAMRSVNGRGWDRTSDLPRVNSSGTGTAGTAGEEVPAKSTNPSTDRTGCSPPFPSGTCQGLA